MAGSKYTLYLGHKFMDITVGEIRRFFEIILRISIETQKMGGYIYYFVQGPMIFLGHGNSFKIRGCDDWEKYSITLVIFK